MGRVSWRQRLRLFCWSTLASISAAVSFAVLSIAWAGDCPNGKVGSPRFTLRVEYQVQWEGQIKFLRAQHAPADVRGPEKIVLLIRDGYSRRRETGKDWQPVDPNPDQPRLDELDAKMDALERSGMPNPNEMNALLAQHVYLLDHPKYEVVRIDNVEMRTPTWEAEYDNVTKKGRKAVYGGPWTAPAVSAEDAMVADWNRWAAQVGAKVMGERKVAGYRCTVYTSAMTNESQFCIAKVGDRQVLLESRVFGVPFGPVFQKAMKVEPGACVDLSRFDIPHGVRFDE